MHIIYHCVGGAHSSVIASAIHLGMLPKTRVATNSEILSIPYYDNITRNTMVVLFIEVSTNTAIIYTPSAGSSPAA